MAGRPGNRAGSSSALLHGFSFVKQLTRGHCAHFCVVVLAAIFFAGLRPFCAPRNKAVWLGARNGIQLGRDAVALSERAFRTASPDGNRTLEVLLEPEQVSSSGSILAFDNSADAHFPLTVGQRSRSVTTQGAGTQEIVGPVAPGPPAAPARAERAQLGLEELRMENPVLRRNRPVDPRALPIAFHASAPLIEEIKSQAAHGLHGKMDLAVV